MYYGCVYLSLRNTFDWLCKLQSIFYSPASLQVIQRDLLKENLLEVLFVWEPCILWRFFLPAGKHLDIKWKKLSFLHISRNIILPGILFFLTCPDGEVWDYEAHDTSLEMWEFWKHCSPSCIIRAVNLFCHNLGNCKWEGPKELPRMAMIPNYYSL